MIIQIERARGPMAIFKMTRAMMPWLAIPTVSLCVVGKINHKATINISTNRTGHWSLVTTIE